MSYGTSRPFTRLLVASFVRHWVIAPPTLLMHNDLDLAPDHAASLREQQTQPMEFTSQQAQGLQSNVNAHCAEYRFGIDILLPTSQ
jgi:hypothetical protein